MSTRKKTRRRRPARPARKRKTRRRKRPARPARRPRQKRVRRRRGRTAWPYGKAMTVQSVVLDKDWFTQRQAEAWIRRNGFALVVLDVTANTYRFRQRPPSQFHRGSFRTVAQTAPGVNLVVGKLKG